MGIKRQYIAIDLKSFYASVECVERGLDPLDACLVVADKSRTDKTICLAVSPSLKSFGIGGRPRLFEVVRRVAEVNLARGNEGHSTSGSVLTKNRHVAVDYIVAPPRMALYVNYSKRIVDIYLRHVSSEDLHVYSVDEVFIDATSYLELYGLTAHEFTIKLIREVLAETGITATAGIGTNLYLCKVAMDIVAKKMPADGDGVRIAELDEMQYRHTLWDHKPMTDFWRVGKGTMQKLQLHGIFTMGELARCSIHNEDLLYELFGVNAELLIDHAWGWEPVTIDYIKSYTPQTHSISAGQVLSRPYTFHQAKNVILEMIDNISLELLDKHLITDQLVIEIGYDTSNLKVANISSLLRGKITSDRYGRRIPDHAHGSVNIGRYTSSSQILIEKTCELFERIVNRNLFIRRLNISANHLKSESKITDNSHDPIQLDIFTDYEELRKREELKNSELTRERQRQEAILGIKKRFGKNAILRGLNFSDGATQRERNEQIGGHKS